MASIKRPFLSDFQQILAGWLVVIFFACGVYFLLEFCMAIRNLSPSREKVQAIRKTFEERLTKGLPECPGKVEFSMPTLPEIQDDQDQEDEWSDDAFKNRVGKSWDGFLDVQWNEKEQKFQPDDSKKWTFDAFIFKFQTESPVSYFQNWLCPQMDKGLASFLESTKSTRIAIHDASQKYRKAKKLAEKGSDEAKELMEKSKAEYQALSGTIGTDLSKMGANLLKQWLQEIPSYERLQEVIRYSSLKNWNSILHFFLAISLLWLSAVLYLRLRLVRGLSEMVLCPKPSDHHLMPSADPGEIKLTEISQDGNTANLTLMPGESFFLSPFVLQGKKMKRELFIHLFQSPFSRAVHSPGTYWASQHLFCPKEQEEMTVQLKGNSTNNRYQLLRLEKGEKWFINTEALVGFSDTIRFHTHLENLGKISCVAGGFSLPITAAGPGYILLYGNGLRKYSLLSEKSSDLEVMVDQLVAFPADVGVSCQTSDPVNIKNHFFNVVCYTGQWAVFPPISKSVIVYGVRQKNPLFKPHVIKSLMELVCVAGIVFYFFGETVLPEIFLSGTILYLLFLAGLYLYQRPHTWKPLFVEVRSCWRDLKRYFGKKPETQEEKDDDLERLQEKKLTILGLINTNQSFRFC